MLVAEPPHAHEPCGWWHDDAGFALDWFDQNRCGIRRHRLFHGGEIPERNRTEARREWTKIAAVIGLRREPDNGCGAAVKIPVGNDDFGAIARNAFATVPPAT